MRKRLEVGEVYPDIGSMLPDLFIFKTQEEETKSRYGCPEGSAIALIQLAQYTGSPPKRGRDDSWHRIPS